MSKGSYVQLFLAVLLLAGLGTYFVFHPVSTRGGTTGTSALSADSAAAFGVGASTTTSPTPTATPRVADASAIVADAEPAQTTQHVQQVQSQVQPQTTNTQAGVPRQSEATAGDPKITGGFKVLGGGGGSSNLIACGDSGTTGSVGPVAVTITCNAAIGDRMIVFAWGDSNATTNVTAADSGSNSYTTDVFQGGANNQLGAIITSVLTSGMTSGVSTVTTTMVGTYPVHWHFVLYKMSGAMNGTADASGSNTQVITNSGSPSGTGNGTVSTSGSTTNANDAVVALFIGAGDSERVTGSGAYGAGYTGLFSYNDINGDSASIEWEPTTTTGTQTATIKYNDYLFTATQLIAAYKGGGNSVSSVIFH